MLCVCPPHAGEVKLLPSLFQGHSNVNKPNGSKIKWYICGYCTAVFSSLPSLRPLDVECKGHWSRRNTVSTSHNVFCVLVFFFSFSIKALLTPLAPEHRDISGKFVPATHISHEIELLCMSICAGMRVNPGTRWSDVSLMTPHICF